MTVSSTTPQTGHVMPRAQSRSDSSGGAAPLRNNGYRILQVVLFVAGAVLLPLGLVVIVLGWYGAAHTPYAYDQLSYLVSGGLLGLGLTFCGGFLYFGAWLARIAADQRESAKRLSDTLRVLTDVVSRNAVAAPGAGTTASAATRDPGDVLVVAGEGTTVHRADCSFDRAPRGPAPCRSGRSGAHRLPAVPAGTGLRPATLSGSPAR